jgi:ketosteroid isomerase-like protein
MPYSYLIGLVILLVGCRDTTNTSSLAKVRREIEAEIARSVEATRSQNIDAYMAGTPDDLVIRDESGEIITKEKLRANTLRDWGIIPKTIAISMVIDSIEVTGDTATVFTSQRWQRLMLERDGKTTDTVLTTQKHKEIWRRTARGWLRYEVTELGGDVFVNGKLYKE